MALNKTSNFPQRLAIALSNNNISSTDLAKRIGMSKQAVSTYTTGARSPKLPTVRLIAEILDVDDMWLMGYDVPMEINKSAVRKDSELIFELFKQLDDDDRKKILEIARLYAGNQDK